MKTTPIISVCGPSGAGKTTWITSLLPRLRRRDLSIAVAKLCHHDPDIEPSRKDSAKHLAAGAGEVLLLSPGKKAILAARAHQSNEDEIVRFAIESGADLVIAEGARESRFPKIVVKCTEREWDIPEPFPLLAKVGSSPFGRTLADWSDPETAASGILRYLDIVNAACGVTGVVLAGGRGIRLGGESKARIELAGATLLDRASASLAAFVSPIVVSAPDAERFFDLPVAVIEDTPDIAGPLGGVLACLRESPGGALFLGVDHFAVSLDSLARLLASGIESGAATLSDGQHDCPTVSFISGNQLSAVERMACQGVRRLTTVLDRIHAARVHVDCAELRDVDYPEDLARLSDTFANTETMTGRRE